MSSAGSVAANGLALLVIVATLVRLVRLGAWSSPAERGHLVTTVAVLTVALVGMSRRFHIADSLADDLAGCAWTAVLVAYAHNLSTLRREGRPHKEQQ